MGAGLAPHSILLALVVVAAAFGAGVAWVVPLPDGEHDFNSPAFVMRHAWVKFAWLATEPLRDDLAPEEEDAAIARYFELNDLIGLNERRAGDPATPADEASAARATAEAERDERQQIENRVERILEGRLTAAIKRAGLTRDVGPEIVWPPVSIEFDAPPSLLVTSPRARIERHDERLLDGGLALERVQTIEADEERDGETSALVVRLGGIAMYPAIIPPSPDYGDTVETAAHEWIHHYLFFTPLGRSFYEGGDLVTLNETVANLAGAELACMIVACGVGGGSVLAYPQMTQMDGDEGWANSSRTPRFVVSDGSMGVVDATSAPAVGDGVDFGAEMRGLRLRVEALLRNGRIDEAEALMEEKRRFLADSGFYIRRINQAYFAFHGSYADSAASIDPIGPKLEFLRRRSPSLEAFIEAAREFESEEELDRALLAQ